MYKSFYFWFCTVSEMPQNITNFERVQTSGTRNSMGRRNSKEYKNTNKHFFFIILELCSFVKTTNATTDFASKAMKKEERSALIWNLEMPYRNIGSDVTLGWAIFYQKCSWNSPNFTISTFCYKLQSELRLRRE